MPIGVAVATALFFSAQIVHAQSTVGELLDKGGKKLLKEDYAAMFPYAMKYWWPQGDGEGDLLVRADGTLSGTEYHYQRRGDRRRSAADVAGRAVRPHRRKPRQAAAVSG